MREVTESQRDQLPVYGVKRFHIDEPAGSYDMLEVKCPRKGCGLAHWVVGSWLAPREVQGRDDDAPAIVTGRPCPYCSKAASIPEELRIEPVWLPEPEPEPAKPKRRTVKRRKRS